MYLHLLVIVPDPQHNNKKCGPEGSLQRVFDLRDQEVTEERCVEECANNHGCVAFSGRWDNTGNGAKWCVGCAVELTEPTTTPGDKGAIAFKKQSMFKLSFFMKLFNLPYKIT